MKAGDENEGQKTTQAVKTTGTSSCIIGRKESKKEKTTQAVKNHSSKEIEKNKKV
jgi:hypothetical protein